MSGNAEQYTYIHETPTYIPFLIQLLHTSLKIDIVCQEKFFSIIGTVMTSFPGDFDGENMKF